MRTQLRSLFASALLLIGVVSVAHAEVKTVKMKIAGYLCGN
jgi:hypothetical protein